MLAIGAGILDAVRMELRQVSGCEGGECPKVFLTDRGTAVFQGNLLADGPGLRVGPGEQAVELPLPVVLAAVDAIAGSRP